MILEYISLVLGSAVLIFIMFFWSARIREMVEDVKGFPVLDPVNKTCLPASPPLVSLIVPAHNEQDLISTCLRSIIDQDYPNLEIICVDDRSVDRTAEIVSELFRGRLNCRLVSIKERLSGWTGKCHALNEAVKHAKGEWFAFVDADSSLHGSALKQCMDEALRRKVDLITLSPKFVLNTFWERALVPTFAAMAAILFPFAKVNDPHSSVATANGMFLIISRLAYETIGGHCNVKDLAVEDIGIGKRVKAAGFSILFANGRNLLRTRMYSDFHEILDGWTRILSAAMNYRLSVVLRYLSMHVLVSLPSFAISVFLYSQTAMKIWPTLWFLAPLVCFIQMVVASNLFFDQLGLPRRLSIYVAIGNLMLIWIFAVMVKKILCTDALQWRGTTYQYTRYQPKYLEPSEPEQFKSHTRFRALTTVNEPETSERPLTS
ncbi:MAG: glycosyltransferase family 2 protein [Deltaproteobacteria bacterium]|nr:glycosyltransferase family 2 protein [Deltaproteobacteria bacterium]